MTTYILLTKMAGLFREPGEFKILADEVSRRIKDECPGVKWKHSYATMSGECDVVDIIEAKNPHEVQRAVMLIRSLSGGRTVTMAATPWDDFIETL